MMLLSNIGSDDRFSATTYDVILICNHLLD
jgi:hypothetical protein